MRSGNTEEVRSPLGRQLLVLRNQNNRPAQLHVARDVFEQPENGIRQFHALPIGPDQSGRAELEHAIQFLNVNFLRLRQCDGVMGHGSCPPTQRFHSIATIETSSNQSAKKGKRGDELPAELARRESRLKKIREAKAALEQEAKEKAERQRAGAEATIAERREQEARRGKKAGGRDPVVPDAEQAKPEAKAQRNFADPESRIMVDGSNKGSFVQGYNAQVAVDSQAQVIAATEVTQAANDSQHLAPMIEQVAANMGRKPEAIGTDAGYWSEDNVSDEHAAGIDLHIATGRQKHPHGEASEPATGPPAEEASAQEAMRHKLRTEAGHAIYKMRKAIVEPVFGQTKERRGFRQFSFRGKDNVGAEWKLICLTHNLPKLFRSGWSPQTA